MAIAPPMPAPEPSALARAGLTPQELLVIEAAVAGLSSKATARRLGCAEGTVKTHRHSAFKKLGVRGAPALLSLYRPANSARRNPAVWALLTPGEADVVEALARGVSVRVAAAELGRALNTVKVQLSRVYKKLGVSSRIRMLRVAYDVRGEGE